MIDQKYANDGLNYNIIALIGFNFGCQNDHMQSAIKKKQAIEILPCTSQPAIGGFPTKFTSSGSSKNVCAVAFFFELLSSQTCK